MVVPLALRRQCRCDFYIFGLDGLTGLAVSLPLDLFSIEKIERVQDRKVSGSRLNKAVHVTGYNLKRKRKNCTNAEMKGTRGRGTKMNFFFRTNSRSREGKP